MKHWLMKTAAALLGGMTLSAHAATLDIGSEAPDFDLPSVAGQDVNLADHRGKYVVLEWVNHGCPFVRKFYNVDAMQELQREMGEKGVVWLSICSSASGKQGHMSVEDWQAFNEENDVAASAVLLDEDGTVGKAYGARTTPHMYVIDPEGTLIYQGAIDSIRSADSDDIGKAQNYVVAALEAAMAGNEIANSQTEPYGCSVKY